MTRDEFMAYAENEISLILTNHKNRLMDLVYKAWAEGKRNAEIDRMTEMMRKALENMDQKEQKNEKSSDHHPAD